MAAVFGVMVVVISLSGLSAAAPARAPPPRADKSPGRLYKTDALHNEINDLILPLLTPRRKTANADMKPQLQLTELVPPLGKPGDGKNRDKNPVAILVADLPAQGREDEQDDSVEPDESRDGENDELDEGSESETREAHLDQPAHHVEEVNEGVSEDITASEEIQEARAAEKDHLAAKEVAEEVHEENKASELERHSDALNEVVPSSDEAATAETVADSQEHTVHDHALDKGISALKALSHNIVSALSARADHPTEAADEERVLECVERKSGDHVHESPSAEMRVADTDYRAPEAEYRVPEAEYRVQEAEYKEPEAERQGQPDVWKYYRTETRSGDEVLAHDEPHRGAHKAYNLSFSFTK